MTLLVTYTIGHHFGFATTALGARFSKWGLKRHNVKLGGKRSVLLPSNSYLLVMAIVFSTVLALATVGPDQISLDEPFLGFTLAAKQAKRSVDDYMRDVYNAELIRSKHHDTIHKSFWTAGNRFGFMAFASMPLLVVLALKSGPFGFLTPRWFTGLHWDKVGTFHRAGGWFIWGMVTIHAGMWITQLFIWNYNGRPMFLMMTIANRFRSAIVAYICMTTAMFTSFRRVRDRMYEYFYPIHCGCILICFTFAIIHHRMVGYWLAICLGLWFGDRATRITRIAWINGYFGTSNVAASNSFTQKYEAEANESIVDIPAGFAQAQLLPSKTVRLSIRTHRPMKWAPGQSLLLRLPELAQLQTHPFTIANNDPREIVLLIKARKGLTLDLYNLVLSRARKALQPSDKRYSILPKANPIHVKAAIDGPMGSAGRVRWTNYSTVLIVVGGTGVTFGLAVCDHLTRVMSQPGYKGSTKRIRFVWIVREYAEITWAASALCRFLVSLSHKQLEINIYVTNGEKSTKVLRQRRSGGKPIGGSTSSFEDEVPEGLEKVEYLDSSPSNFGPDPETGMPADEDLRSLTNFRGEEDNDDVKDRRLSRMFQKEGRDRRRSSRAANGKSGLVSRSPVGFRSWNWEQDTTTSVYSTESILDLYSEPDVPPMPMGSAMRVANLMTKKNVPGDSRDSEELLRPRPQLHSQRSNRESETYVIPPAPAPPKISNPPRAKMKKAKQQQQQQQQNAPRPPPKDRPKNTRPVTDVASTPTYKAFTWRTQDMVLLENTPDAKEEAGCTSCGHCEGESLWIDQGDYTAAKIMSENAVCGRPPLQSIIKEETERTKGWTVVATCGPQGLNVSLRNLVAASTAKLAMYSEDFEM